MTTNVTPPQEHRGDVREATPPRLVGAGDGLQPNNTDSSPSPTAQNDMQTMWLPLINKTVATEGKGIAELAESISRHVAHLHTSGDWAVRDRARLRSELEAALSEALIGRFLQTVPQKKYQDVLEKVMNRNISPYEAVDSLLDGISKS